MIEVKQRKRIEKNQRHDNRILLSVPDTLFWFTFLLMAMYASGMDRFNIHTPCEKKGEREKEKVAAMSVSIHLQQRCPFLS
jgi:hypothetical protein